MNDSIPQPPRRIATRIVLPTLVIGTAVGLLAWSSWRAWAPLTKVHGVPVILRAAAVVTNSHTQEDDGGTSKSANKGPVVQAPGWIEPSPFPILAPALTPSVVREILVLEGDRVAKDQVVAKLVDDEEILVLRRAEAELAIKNSELAALEDELNRKEKLVSAGTISQGEAARLAIKVQGARAAVELAQAIHDESLLALRRTEVRSPASGLVMARLTAPGALVGTDASNSTVVQIFDPQQLQVRTDVPLAEAGRLAVGLPAEVLVDALPGRVIKAHVLRLVQQADIAKNTVQAKVLLEDPPAGLVPDMLARVRIFTAPASSARTSGESDRTELAAPESALGSLATTDAGTRRGTVRVVVDLRDGVGRIEDREVECDGQSDPTGWTTVLSGLRPGDVVVTNGSPGTKAGELVRLVGESAATPNKGAHDGHK